MTYKLALAAAALVLVSGCASPETAAEDGAEPRSTVEQPPPPSSEYSEAYFADVHDTADSLAELIQIMSGVIDRVLIGALSHDEFAELSMFASEVVATHYDHFEDAPAPTGHQRTHDLFLSAIAACRDGFEVASRGAQARSQSLTNEAAGLMRECADLIRQTSERMP